MPKSDDTLINDELIESGLVPSIISWKSKKPVYQMVNNHFQLEKIQIELNKYIEIEYKSLLKKNLNDIGNCGWVNDIVSMKHENQFTRIFRT